MGIFLNNLQKAVKILPEQEQLLERVIQSGLIRHHHEAAEVSVVLVDNDYIQNLNSQYRGLDQPTDVLSFAMLEDSAEELPVATEPPIGPEASPVKQGAPVVPENQPELLGDIFISVERAKEQAADYGHSVNRELCYLAVHGLLHLVGFDHQNPVDQERMRRAEEEILTAAGLGRE